MHFLSLFLTKRLRMFKALLLSLTLVFAAAFAPTAYAEVQSIDVVVVFP